MLETLKLIKCYKQMVSGISIDEPLKVTQKSLIDESVSHGWKRFKSAIETKKSSQHKGSVFVNDEVTPSEHYTGSKITATNRQVGGYLHYGTPDHGPVKAKRLSWISGGIRFFALKVKGIKAYNWWGLTDKIKTEVLNSLNKAFKRG